MIWGRLKNFKCPECNRGLFHNALKKTYDCAIDGFSISYQKFDSLVGELYGKKALTEDENTRLSELNNL